MTTPPDEDAWKRLGHLLAQRRVEIGARYKNKNLFAEERELNRRMVWSVEKGERDTYGTDTLRAVEAAYMLEPGSVGRTLAGGPLEPSAAGRTAAASAAPRPDAAHRDLDDAAAALFPGDRTMQAIWRLPEPVEVREGLIGDLRRLRREAGSPGVSLAEDTA